MGEEIFHQPVKVQAQNLSPHPTILKKKTPPEPSHECEMHTKIGIEPSVLQNLSTQLTWQSAVVYKILTEQFYRPFQHMRLISSQDRNSGMGTFSYTFQLIPKNLLDARVTDSIT